MVTKRYHEIRDSIHGFIKLDSDERRVLDSPPVQRLRHIHQLAMSYLVYPGATHKRFEHSLGVMELAGRVFDVLTAQDNIHDSVRQTVMNLTDEQKAYWRRVLRMAALCHDIGHLPFSHAAEKELLPEGRSHESITADLIRSDLMAEIWEALTPPLRPLDIAKISVGQKYMAGETFTDWELLLYEIIGGDSFGVDRMDYLLRDSHHAGVAYGKFDHLRLIETMRVLPVSQQDDSPALGVESGGIHSTEALLLARYFMFMQVYCHPVRVAYDLHLKEFLLDWLPGGKFPQEWDCLKTLTDDQVLSGIADAAQNQSSNGYSAAYRVVNREHYRRAYTLTPSDTTEHENPIDAVADACSDQYGSDKVLRSTYQQSSPVTDFPVLDSQGQIESSLSVSTPLNQIPVVNVGYVLMDPEIVDEAMDWIFSNKNSILSSGANEKG